MVGGNDLKPKCAGVNHTSIGALPDKKIRVLVSRKFLRKYMQVFERVGTKGENILKPKGIERTNTGIGIHRYEE